MRSYWEQLSERDRAMLIVGGVVCVVYLFYQLIYAPLTHAIQLKSRQWIEKTETLDWMRAIRKQGLPKSLNKVEEHNLLSLFDHQLKQSFLAHFHYELQQVAEDRVQLSFDQVPFDGFMEWFRELSDQYQMQVTEWNAERTETAGVVRMKVVVGL